ncbi:3-deoxy-D-manno-octulosonic acid transferase [hydrothermal vent metagenome]|uniref:lipid IVA 3-deoxy-D-manno-octulosonic acid transferase n=1 Tax=hydrothermal vent metagenome TaxID=652676 RepID=A0A3B0Z0T2_9ZZZZ
MPLAFLRLWWRGFRQPAYRSHWRERLGYVSGPVENSDVVWIHAVSVGEVRAAAPLVNALLQRDPGAALLITTTTPTGRDTVAQLFSERVQCCYLPWDLPFVVQRFLSSFNPQKLIVMETELWPNLFHSVKQRGIPLYLVNARLSDASLRGYRRVLPLARKTLSCVTSIAAQSEADVSRFIALGAPEERVQCAGNLKYEVELPTDFDQRRSRLRQQFGQRTLWVAGSTHPGEDPIMLSAHARLLQRYPDCLLLLVPRHPERAKEVAALCTQSGMRVVLYSELAELLSENTRVVVVDVLGELVYLYGLAPLAFIGGSLVPHGGQNPIEALQAGCAVISGEHVENFADSYRELECAGAVSCIKAEADLVKVVDDLLGDAELRQRQLVAAEQVLDGNRGALGRVLALTDLL